MDTKFSDPLDPLCVLASGRTEDHELRLRLLHASSPVRVDLGGSDLKGRDSALHALRPLIGDPDELYLRVLMGEAQVVPHVHMIKVDPDDAPPLAHIRSPFNPASCLRPASRTAPSTRSSIGEYPGW